MVSPSTLIRQAHATKNKTKAAALRKEAAKLRRSFRQKMKKRIARSERVRAVTEAKLTNLADQAAARKHRKRKQPTWTLDVPSNLEKAYHAEAKATGSSDVALSAVHDRMSAQAEPPLVPSERIERLRELASKRNDKAGFEIALRALFVDGKVSGRKEEEERNSRNLKAVQESHAIQIVASFMAIIKDHERRNRGPLPATVTLSGHIVAKIYDALREAGYTENGKGTATRNYS